MENVLLTVHLILALLLIGVVLLQRSEGGGLLSGGGAMSARGAANALTKLTWALAAAFIGTSILLTLVASVNTGGGSVMDQAGTEVPAESAPAPGLLGDDLTPPPSATEGAADAAAPADGDAPVTPPASN